MLKYSFLAGSYTCNVASCMYASVHAHSNVNYLKSNKDNFRIHIISMTMGKTLSKTQPHADLTRVKEYEICLIIIEYNGDFYTRGREAVNLVSSVQSLCVYNIL